MFLLSKLWADDQGQDIAEYAVMLAVTPPCFPAARIEALWWLSSTNSVFAP